MCGVISKQLMINRALITVLIHTSNSKVPMRKKRKIPIPHTTAVLMNDKNPFLTTNSEPQYWQ